MNNELSPIVNIISLPNEKIFYKFLVEKKVAAHPNQPELESFFFFDIPLFCLTHMHSHSLISLNYSHNKKTYISRVSRHYPIHPT